MSTKPKLNLNVLIQEFWHNQLWCSSSPTLHFYKKKLNLYSQNVVTLLEFIRKSHMIPDSWIGHIVINAPQMSWEGRSVEPNGSAGSESGFLSFTENISIKKSILLWLKICPHVATWMALTTAAACLCVWVWIRVTNNEEGGPAQSGQDTYQNHQTVGVHWR